MASKEAFEDHCWKDVMSADDMKLYSPYARETFVGPSVAFLAIDLYNLVYRGGPGAPVDLDPQFPNSCGIYAHRAIEPTKRLFAAARAAGIPIFYTTQDTRPDSLPSRVTATKRQRVPQDPSLYQIKAEFNTPGIQVLQVSQTAVTEQDRAHGLDQGTDMYLIEPFGAVRRPSRGKSKECKRIGR